MLRVSTNKYSMNRKCTFQITAITLAIFIPFRWIFSPWFLISLGLICQHSGDTYLIFWNSERDQPPHNLFHLSFRTAAHDERRFMLDRPYLSLSMLPRLYEYDLDDFFFLTQWDILMHK